MIWTRALAAPGARALRPAQEAALTAAWRADTGPWGPRGVLGLVGCGHGKTLIAQLAPLVCGAQRPVLLHPAALAAQTERDAAAWAAEYPVARPTRLHYEALSHPRGAARLDDLRPDLLILDEAHELGNPRSARWRRVARYLTAHPECRVIALSGTLTWGEIGQLAHLAHATLRDLSPFPAEHLAAIAAVVDVGGEPTGDDWRIFESAFGPGPRSKNSARARVFGRLVATPGVVHAPGVAADVSLRIERLPEPVSPASVTAALDVLRDRWELPDGTELVTALEHGRHAASLRWGWYSRWVPGTVDPEWNAARLGWARAARAALEYEVRHLDTPAQIEELAEAGGGELSAYVRRAWDTWSPYRTWDDPPTEIVWLDGAADWAAGVVRATVERAGPDTIAWYSSRAMEQVVRAAGYPVHGAGSAAPAGGSAGASILVHGAGWNGQAYHRQVVLEPPSSSRTWEQLLARTHRPGQTRDVWVGVLGGESAIGSALAGAHYATEVLGTPQRLTLATWL